MQDDLKHYRAPRSPWPWVLLVAVAIAMLAVIGPMHYADDLEIEAELKILRAERAAARKPQSEPAAIWCRRCGPEPFIAMQADGGGWRCRCAGDLTKEKQ